MRLILIAALCLAVSPANAQAWKHWEASQAIRQAAPTKAGKPSTRYGAARTNNGGCVQHATREFSLPEMIRLVTSGSLALPDFQRPFVSPPRALWF